MATEPSGSAPEISGGASLASRASSRIGRRTGPLLFLVAVSQRRSHGQGVLPLAGSAERGRCVTAFGFMFDSLVQTLHTVFSFD